MKLPKVYEPSAYEADIYALWEKSGAFTADPSSGKEHFSISMPPPNETGTLSLGHALFFAVGLYGAGLSMTHLGAGPVAGFLAARHWIYRP